ncbi:translation initiation inhibitor [Mycolicibacterium murale]|uniref:Translation initiation inhibitor n=1 Tax=Mycolicibacterium murale TaxID=182220 RepID=A0A7I9WVN3_9MYCO|nr:RidA family protein [Mycolicibacterium murale]MCV7185645.1 RidA family protein [Mycolicibacterium murale]GFG61745.1 translation initiation inhibitor [Mycolicibacterium murale]
MITYQDAPLPKFGDYSTLGLGTPGEVVVVAGQMGADSTGAFPTSDGAEQVKATFDNLGAALAAAGLGFEHVVGFRTYVVGREMIPEFMKGRIEKFAEIYPSGVYPPNTLLIIGGLVEEAARVEIEALAVRPAAAS